MSDTFDPDEYIKERGIPASKPESGPDTFDPDAFLAEAQTRRPAPGFGRSLVNAAARAELSKQEEDAMSRAIESGRRAAAFERGGPVDPLSNQVDEIRGILATAPSLDRDTARELWRTDSNRALREAQSARDAQAAFPASDASRDLATKSGGERLIGNLTSPAVAAETVAGMMPGLAKPMAVGMLTGGAGLLAESAAMGALGYSDERRATVVREIMDEAAKRRIDIDDPAALRSLVADDNFMSKVESDAEKRGAIMGAVMAGTAGIGRVATRAGQWVRGTEPVAALPRRLAGQTAATGAEGGLNAAANTAGEAVGQLATDGTIDNPDALYDQAGSGLMLGMGMRAVHALPELMPGRRVAADARESAAKEAGASEPAGDTVPETSRPAERAEARPEADPGDDILGAADIGARRAEVRRADNEARKRDSLMNAPDDVLFDRFAREMRDRADGVRSAGGEGDAWLSSVEAELRRAADEQQGRGRDFSREDFARRLGAILPDADPDFRDALALRLYGADAATSRDALARGLAEVRMQRTRALVADEPARSARLAREAEESRARDERAAAGAERTARAATEHEAELRRLDEARVTPDGAPDWAKFTDNDLEAMAHGDEATPFLKTIAEAQRLQDADPDLIERPRGTLFNRWREMAGRELEARGRAAESESDAGPSLRDLLLSGKIRLPNDAATYAGELRALRESLTPAERLRIFRSVDDGVAGDRMLERLAERLTVDDGFGFLQSSGADLLDAVKRSADGEHLRPDWSEGRIESSRENGAPLDPTRKFAERWVETPHDDESRRLEDAVRRSEIRGRKAGDPAPRVHVAVYQPSADHHLQAGRLEEALGKAFGKRIRYVSVEVDGHRAADGMIDTAAPNTIWLDPRSSRPFATIIGHELVETMVVQRPDLYAKLRRALGPLVKDWRLVDDHMRETRGYAEARTGSLRKEFIADFVGNSIGKKVFGNVSPRRIGDCSGSLPSWRASSSTPRSPDFVRPDATTSLM